MAAPTTWTNRGGDVSSLADEDHRLMDNPRLQAAHLCAAIGSNRGSHQRVKQGSVSLSQNAAKFASHFQMTTPLIGLNSTSMIRYVVLLYILRYLRVRGQRRAH